MLLSTVNGFLYLREYYVLVLPPYLVCAVIFALCIIVVSQLPCAAHMYTARLICLRFLFCFVAKLCCGCIALKCECAGVIIM